MGQGHKEALGFLYTGPQLFLQRFVATTVSQKLILVAHADGVWGT